MDNKRAARGKAQTSKVTVLKSQPSIHLSGIEQSVREILEHLGEDTEREGLVKTPQRVARAYEYFTKGYSQDPQEILNQAKFTEEDYQEMVLVRDIDFFSLCEHHILPFFGRAHVAYIPRHHIVGLSKIPRLVEVFSRRLQVQERLTTQIANTLMEVLDPLGVGVVIRAEHLCMRMRGVEKQNSIVTTSTMLGAFRSQQATREEFITLVNGTQR
ncbi:MAG: GTP cyclohydrolase I FolE [Deltaproteobacteria bacterium]|nr:GTP cyclohydrolase I FolE [Deltaproteobacteria bacterium]